MEAKEKLSVSLVKLVNVKWDRPLSKKKKIGFFSKNFFLKNWLTSSTKSISYVLNSNWVTLIKFHFIIFHLSIGTGAWSEI